MNPTIIRILWAIVAVIWALVVFLVGAMMVKPASAQQQTDGIHERK